MNKRIKKKKAKQAELRRQQEFEEISLDPEQIRLALQHISTAISNVFTNLSIAFANAAESWKKYSEQLEQQNIKERIHDECRFFPKST